MPVESFKRLQEQAYDHLREEILQERFAYGEIYSETRTAARIGISRTPVRDALQRLAQEGFVDILPSRGFCLHRLTAADALETYQARSALEGYCAVLVARQAGQRPACQLLERLEELLSQQQAELEGARDREAFTRIDQQFHTTLVAFAGNRVFDELFHNYLYRIRRLAIQSLLRPGRMETALREHRNMLSVMRAGDVAASYQAVLVHMETPRDINLQNLDASTALG